MATTMPLKIRAFLTYENNPEDLLLRVCVREAFFKLERSWLVGLASHLQMQLPAGASLLDVICVLVTGILGADEADTLQVVARRLASMERMEMFGDELEQLDEAVELLDKNDKAKAKESKREHERLKHEQKELRDGYKENAKVLRAAQVSAAPADTRRRGRAAAKSQRIRVPPFPSHSISIEEARSYLPPNAALWIGAGEGNLQGPLKPFPRCSRSWRKWGEGGALRECLRYLWTRHAQLTGQEVAELPIDGLFEEVGAGASVSAASSSNRPT